MKRAARLGRLLPALSVLASLGCRQAEDRPAYVSIECDAATQCAIPPPLGSGSGGGGGQPGDATSDAATSSVSGSLALITDGDFTTAIAFTDPAIVEMESGSGTPVEASYDGSSFTLHGVRLGNPVWATVRPTTGGNDAMATLQPVDTSSPGPFELLLVSRSVLELVYGVFAIPTLPSADRAQVVLRFLDAATGKPVAGVAVTHPAAETVAYDVAGSYSDAAGASGPLGMAILVNLPALSPQAVQKLQVSTAAGARAIELPLLRDAVTLADVLLAE
jgi:hypothetical protein